MYNTLKKHPAVFTAILGFMAYVLPLAVAGVWGNFSDEKIPGWLEKRGYPGVLKVLIVWTVVALLCSLIFYVIVVFVMPSERPVVHLSYAVADLSEHDNWRMDDCQQLRVTNDGPGRVIGVKVSDIDLRNGSVASFDEIEGIGQGETVLASPNIVNSETGVPVFAPADLAHALHDSVGAQTAAAFGDGRQTIDYPVLVKYRNVVNETFQTEHEIRAYDPPIFLRVGIAYLRVKRVWWN
jgi:hypothetical protein